uniref:MerR family transcriptional regulator n=1 Tax=Thermosporothrix sp. COM3 TaxID=2490863 RepID=A0A455SK98_9CHLR|nr:MerR family transcriptional regulator [Thermosporothrix sp. COM3]
MQKELSIQEVAERTGLSIHALRYYERLGLLDPVHRLPNGHRRFTEDDLAWIAFLQCLRRTNMSIRQMQAFAKLRRQGDAALQERLEFLEEHERNVQASIDELEQSLVVIRRKIRRHRVQLAGGEPEADPVQQQVPLSR